MCDTLVALGSATSDGAAIFAKNSDRPPNEAHQLLRIPAARHAPDETVRCTYIEILQARETYEVILAKPFWIWGAEMGANEHGVAIGNEALFTKVPPQRGPSLLGMDLLRLALERSKTARGALDVITGLLAVHGQGGNCGYRRRVYYHNSFLIADPTEAWVLETAGCHWAAVRVEDIGAISNEITIGNRWDLSSADLVAYAVERGWCKGRDDFHFARCYSDPVQTRACHGRERRRRMLLLLEAEKGTISVESVLRILRDHGSENSWRPEKGLVKASICCHAGFGPWRASQTTGSLVSHLTAEAKTHFVTGTAAPCTGIFKPYWLGAELPAIAPPPGGAYDGAALYWRHEALHRAVLRDYDVMLGLYRDERDSLERRFIEGARLHRLLPPEVRAGFAARCFAEAESAMAAWRERVFPRRPGRTGWLMLHASAWRRFDRRAGMPSAR